MIAQSKFSTEVNYCYGRSSQKESSNYNLFLDDKPQYNKAHFRWPNLLIQYNYNWN